MIHQLIIPRQRISQQETAPFLSWILGQVARKPRLLKLRETAGVARYLVAIAAEMPGGPERVMLEHIAEVIWLTMLKVGRIEIPDQREVIRFLKDHAPTYLVGFDVNCVVEQILGRAEPSRHRELFAPPKLLGRDSSVQGGGTARLRDDLTERIYVGYHALRRAGVRNKRRQIAALLNQLGLTTRARTGTTQVWSSEEVNERVRQFEKWLIQRQRLANSGKDKALEVKRVRDTLVDSWIYRFRLASSGRSRS